MLLPEVSLQQAFEGFAVPRFVAGHFIAELRSAAGEGSKIIPHWNYRLSMVVGMLEWLISLAILGGNQFSVKKTSESIIYLHLGTTVVRHLKTSIVLVHLLVQ